MIDFMIAGTQVEGTYYDAPFVGTVREARWHSLNHQTIEVHVDVEGFAYQGDPRPSLIVSVYDDGSNADSYVGVGMGHSIRVAA